MNDKLDGFRRRLRGEAHSSEPLRVKDWAALVISCIALVLSAWSTYFNVLRLEDDIRVIVDTIPPRPGGTSREPRITGKQRLIFINAGNRSAMITRIARGVIRHPITKTNDISCERASGMTALRYYEFEPLIIKQGEILSREVEFAKDESLKDVQMPFAVTPGIVVADFNKEYIHGCIFFGIVTPSVDSSMDIQLVGMPLFETVLVDGKPTLEESRLPNLGSSIGYQEPRPFGLLRRRGTVLGDSP